MASNFAGRLAIALIVAAASGAAAQTASERITRQQSLVLLDMPGLGAGAREQYDYIGWNDRYSVERHHAVAVAAGGDFPRAQILMQVLAKGFVWLTNTPTEADVRGWPFFKDRALQVLWPAGANSSTEAQTLWFASGDVECVAFSMRRVARGRNDSQPDEGASGFEGFYCAAAGTKVTDALAEAVLGGIYYRSGDKVIRAHGSDQRPIPARLIDGVGAAAVAPSFDPA